jgi:hypothetical protein
MITKKHLIVFLAFREVDVIKKSFESIEDVSSDIFVIENKSENSLEIEEYFKSKSKSLIGYIQFNENTENSSIPLFNKAFEDLIKSYEYVTYTDGDLYAYNAEEMFREIIEGFKNSNAMVCSSMIWTKNHHLLENGKDDLKPLELRGTFDEFLEEQKNNDREFGCKLVPIGLTTGHFFVTYRSCDLDHIFQIPLYSDGSIYAKVWELKREWHMTTKNISYHMSWDLYHEDNPYYKWKRQNRKTIWKYVKESDFRVII